MVYWTFKDYVSPPPSARNKIAQWYGKTLSVQEQSDLDALVQIMAQQKVWSEPNYKVLSGKKYSGLGELRIPGDQKKQIRLIGCKGSTEGEFIFLIGCSHKGKIYDPSDALDTAVKRKKDLSNGKGSTCEHDFEDTDETEEG